MLDFLRISTRYTKSNGLEIYPKFIARRCDDLMIRGSDFYAIWDEEKNLWSTEEDDAIALIDKELDEYQKEHPEYAGANVMYLWDAENGFIDRWHRYVQKQMSDNYKPLDEKLIFANDLVCKTDYASKRLPYALDSGPHEAWDTLIDTLYSPEERVKIEWSIGAIVSGDSKNIQKFLVFYGAQGTGKSTIISIIEKLFQGYYSVFDAKALGLANAAFPLESLKSNPLVAIQHDGDLSHIEDNTRLNSIVSHELMTVNEKFKATYPLRFNSFLIMGTNRPVRITDAKSGMLRRLIDVSPTGNKIPRSKYDKLVDKAKTFELGAIAAHCLDIYENNKKMFNDYVPTTMFGASNDFYNFVIDQYEHFKENDGTTLAEAWPRYNTYCQNAKVPYPLSQRAFKEELKNYFKDFKERVYKDGERSWNKYYGFKADKFDVTSAGNNPEKIDISESDDEAAGSNEEDPGWLIFSEQPSLFDTQFADCPAQYTKEDESPLVAWANVTTTLSALDTSKLHYVDIPEWLIVIDFDLKGEDGTKSFEKNLEAANKWPKTYAELSKSGAGIHLHYIYKGDPKELSRIYEEDIEVKVYTGGSTLRRKLTKCNDIPIAEIPAGILPKKEGKKMLSDARIRSEKGLRKLIERHLQKEITGYTTTSINLIYEILQDAYESGLKYDVSDMRPAVLAFANGSSHQADKCLTKVLAMKFASDELPDNVDTSEDDGKIVFFDVEVFPNLFVVCWKFLGDKVTTKWINPTADMIDDLVNHKPTPYKLVGFNNRKYDNHILYAALMGYNNAYIYNLSQRLISNSPNATIGEAYNLSYTDIYDFSSEKKSLKKFEIEYGIHHQELGLPWDQPVPEELWNTVAEYCVNDVMATEVVWAKRQGDFLAREILADITGMTVNDTTNRLTTKLIFGDDKTPQGQFVYTHLAGEKNCPVEKISEIVSPVTGKKYSVNPEYTQKDLSTGQMMFPGYEYSLQPVGTNNKFKMTSTYRGIEVGEGGLVIANHGMYGRTITKDVTSMHPHSIIALNLFGDHYTKIFEELVHARVAIKKGTKTGDFSAVSSLFGGKLMKYLDDIEKAKMLVTALKIAINSVYGLTAAKFVNAFKDSRNDDNIVAKRGALFMVNLKHEVEDHGGKVIHIKTDSIKVEDLTEDLEDLICAYGALYGYSFETEHIFDRLCLVNDAVYIGKLAEDDPERSNPKSKYIEKNWWEATGEQFAVPYVFKTLFSHQPIEFDDMFETMSVTSALYLDMNEGLPDSTALEKELDKLRKKENPDMARITTLEQEITKCHNYIFVGKAGAFCPIKPGCGGGVLVRENHGKYASAGGAKGYRWMEAEVVHKLNKEEDIDRNYYIDLVNKAADTISSFGDFEAFTR